MTGLGLAEIEQARRQPHRTALLFLTDRCPVGCGHCSVDSRPGTPNLDLDLLGRLVDGLCAVPDLAIVGVSGGEPFVERRGLTLAVDRLTGAGRQVVLYTSGVWAGDAQPPDWIDRVLRQSAHVVLSTDGYHAARLPSGRFVAAARAVVAAGTRLSVQVVDLPGAHAAADDLLGQAFGPTWAEQVELRRVPLLPYGRAAGQPDLSTSGRPGAWFGRCPVATSPVLRHDGQIVGCCNEQVLTGHGPATLRRRVTTADQTVAAFADLRADPHLRSVSQIGLGPLTGLTGLTDLATREFTDPCQLCWAIARRRADPDTGVGDRVATLLRAHDALRVATHRTGARP